MMRINLLRGAVQKECSRCGRAKPLGEFYSAPDRSLGVMSTCKACGSDAARARYAVKKGHVGALGKEYYKRNRLARLARMRRVHLKNKYGIDVAAYDALLSAQGGVCKICHRVQRNAFHKNLSVDHDHATGAIRGLLCTPCNSAIGLLGDDPARLRSAADYIEGSKR